MRDLVRQLAGMGEDEAAGAVLRHDLLKDGEHEDSGLTHARVGLADDVRAEDCLWDDLELHLRRMLETAVRDGTQKLGLQKEVLERRRVHSAVRIYRSV